MSRSYDFVVVGVIAIISSVIHLMAVELFAPDKPLHGLASDGTAVLNGAERADLWFQILAIWVPVLSIGAILLWSMLREYRRQVSTATRPAR